MRSALTCAASKIAPSRLAKVALIRQPPNVGVNDLFKDSASIELSIILVSYKMNRELPRTLFTLLPPYQKIPTGLEYEIIVVDNGSPEQSVDISRYSSSQVPVHHIRYEEPSQSPVKALNHGISFAKGRYVCACIDAARMFSPGLISNALMATKLSSRAVVGTMSLHLGHEAQNISVRKGYNQTREDMLLQTVNWEFDGYQLFRIASFDPSSRFGQFRSPAETNALTMHRSMWELCQGFDERFISAGGGLANLDIWKRLSDDQTSDVIMLLGEATFHQFHGGTATNALVDPWNEMHHEYIDIRQAPYEVPKKIPFVFGRLGLLAAEFLEASLSKQRQS